MQVRHPKLGQPDVVASVEFARRSLILPPERSSFVKLPVHRVYEVELPELLVIAEAEACAEKLARYRRVTLGRDVYDLAQFASGAMDETLVRRLWILKVWGDVVDDDRGDKPVVPADVLRLRSESDFASDSIGNLPNRWTSNNGSGLSEHGSSSSPSLMRMSGTGQLGFGRYSVPSAVGLNTAGHQSCGGLAALLCLDTLM